MNERESQYRSWVRGSKDLIHNCTAVISRARFVKFSGEVTLFGVVMASNRYGAGKDIRTSRIKEVRYGKTGWVAVTNSGSEYVIESIVDGLVFDEMASLKRDFDSQKDTILA